MTKPDKNMTSKNHKSGTKEKEVYAHTNLDFQIKMCLLYKRSL